MYVSCRGTPFKYAARAYQPTIRAGRSHLPCGTIGRARLAEEMGGTGSGKRKPPHEGAGKTTTQTFFAALHFWRGNMCLCVPGSTSGTGDGLLPGCPHRRSLGSISAGRPARCILSRSGRTCPCCQVADLQRGLWLDAGGLPPLPAHAGRWDSTRPAGRRQRRRRTGGRYGAA